MQSKSVLLKIKSHKAPQKENFVRSHKNVKTKNNNLLTQQTPWPKGLLDQIFFRVFIEIILRFIRA